MRIDHISGSNSPSEKPPSWAGKIGRRIARVFTGDAATNYVPSISPNDSVTQFGLDGTGYRADNPISWRIQQTRKASYLDIESMDSSDELIATALDILADCAVAFLSTESEDRIEIQSDNDQIKEILNNLITRVDLQNDVWQMCREMIKHGSIFREIILERNQKSPHIIKLKQTVSWTIWPKENDKGDKIPGWLQRTDQQLYSNGGQELEEWQIAPFLYGTKYGYLHVPMLEATRRNWYRIQKMEDGMAVARLTRAYDKYAHKIPVRDTWTKGEVMDTIRRYKDSMTKKRMVSDHDKVNQGQSPVDVATDFFLPDDGSGRGGIEILSGNNNQLMNLTDLYYLREKMIARLKVPQQFMQIMSTQKTHVSASGGPNIDVQFARTLKGIQASVRRGLRRIFDIELLLNGIAPTVDNYSIILVPIKVNDEMEQARIELTMAQAAAYMTEAFGALPPDFMASKFLRLKDEEKEMLDNFFAKEGKEIFSARVKAIKEDAKPKPTGGFGNSPGSDSTRGGGKLKDRVVGGDKGSGNNNKSRISRSSEQRGGASQSIPIEEAAHLFASIQQSVNETLEIDKDYTVLYEEAYSRLEDIVAEDSL